MAIKNVKQATTTPQNWDWQNLHVERRIHPGQFVGGATILISSGPPRWGDSAANAGGDLNLDESDSMICYPMGVASNLTLGQTQQLSRIFEIGSKRAYFIPGRHFPAISLGRVFYHGPSILKVLYAYYFDVLEKYSNNPAFIQSLQEVKLNNEPKIKVSQELEEHMKEAVPREIPGYGDLLLNLGSDLFQQPTGLLLYFLDSKDKNVGAVYLEECYITGHNFGVTADAIIVAESVQIQFERILPVYVKLERKQK